MAEILIVGAGYTGSRVAEILRAGGHRVVTTRRSGGDIDLTLPDTAPLASLTGNGWRVLWSAPAIDGIGVLEGRAARVLYLSTTGVYGNQKTVDHASEPSPASERTQERLAAERVVQAGNWSSCILRPAAIYGPGRGAHESIRQGRWRIAGDGSSYTSRIHVDDLAAISAAALLGEIEGSWPVADDEPCTNLAITQFCCDLLGVPLPPAAAEADLDETRRADRRVDGRAIRQELGITLQYPSFREGIPASLAAAS